jgi:hypothetical protein
MNMAKNKENKQIDQENNFEEYAKSFEYNQELDGRELSEEELSEIAGGISWGSVKKFFEGGWGRDLGARRARMVDSWAGRTN